MSRFPLGFIFFLILMLSIFSWPLMSEAEETESSDVQFANSCSEAVRSEFNHAITLLHSFEYLDTTRIFNQIIQKDPTCAMARWGAAMSIWHPLWGAPSAGQLEEGASLLAETDTLFTTDRERAFIDAAKAFFSSTDITTHGARAQAHELSMEQLYRNNLDDPEAAIFYALALLATADSRDKSYQNQFKSAGVLNWVRASQPNHPGVLHYTIHSYDYAALAHLALDSAMDYADAAPDSAHAQHMPSHIFTRMGLWDLSLASNHDSTRSAAEYTIRANLLGHYDEGLHSIDYLMYAMLQTARDEEAEALLVRLGEIEKTNTENFKVAYTYAAAPARLALERRRWDDASRLSLMRSDDFPWASFGWARSINHFARGIGAARSGQLELAREEWALIKTLQEGLPETTLLYSSEEVQVEMDSIMSWILLGEGEADEALRLAASAADREDAVDKHPVTPGEVLPARELYADMLLQLGNYSGALEQYHSVLAGSPNRLNAMLGAALATKALGLTDEAEEFCIRIRNQTRSGDTEREGLKPACG